jgi:hypothetical protein
MKNLSSVLFAVLLFVSCKNANFEPPTAQAESHQTEVNQSNLNQAQPAPRITWSLERDNLIRRFKLQNDRTVMFYMYLFIEGFSEPIGYYQVNKVSSVNSQLTNTEQMVNDSNASSGSYASCVLPSPAEDGSYGTNGDAVFGFTPEEIYIEHNMKYVVSNVPLSFQKPVNKLTVINLKTEQDLKTMMSKIK